MQQKADRQGRSIKVAITVNGFVFVFGILRYVEIGASPLQLKH